MTIFKCLPFKNRKDVGILENGPILREIFVENGTHHLNVLICDAIKQNESEVGKNNILFFWHLLFVYYLNFNMVKTPWRLGNWF